MEQTQKNFRKRAAILECLQQTDLHPSAEWIFTQLKPTYPDLSLGTVYRNLTLFRKQGLAASIGTVNGVERFDANTQPHVHFICTGCGKVLDLHQMQVPQELTQTAATAAGGQITGCQLTFTGQCPDCVGQANVS
jgi:Fur family peroxide stress response transcriptional regulator